MNKLTSITALSLALCAVAYAGAKAIAPEKTSGLMPVVAHENALANQIPSMQGYNMRGRKITLAPGGATAEHSHAERPGIVYVIKGKVNEYRNGEKIEYSAGDTWIETADTVHWVENPSDEPSVIFMVDLPKQN